MDIANFFLKYKDLLFYLDEFLYLQDLSHWRSTCKTLYHIPREVKILKSIRLLRLDPDFLASYPKAISLVNIILLRIPTSRCLRRFTLEIDHRFNYPDNLDVYNNGCSPFSRVYCEILDKYFIENHQSLSENSYDISIVSTSLSKVHPLGNSIVDIDDRGNRDVPEKTHFHPLLSLPSGEEVAIPKEGKKAYLPLFYVRVCNGLIDSNICFYDYEWKSPLLISTTRMIIGRDVDSESRSGMKIFAKKQIDWKKGITREIVNVGGGKVDVMFPSLINVEVIICILPVITIAEYFHLGLFPKDIVNDRCRDKLSLSIVEHPGVSEHGRWVKSDVRLISRPYSLYYIDEVDQEEKMRKETEKVDDEYFAGKGYSLSSCIIS